MLAGPIEVVASDDFPAELQKAAVLATVRFDHGGSGVIVKQQAPFVYVLTAAHVVADADRVNVLVFTADSYPDPARTYRGAEVLARAKDADLALVRLTTTDAMPGAVPVCPPERLPAGADFAALSAGCDTGRPPTCHVERVTQKKKVRRRDAAAAWFWEAREGQAHGRSGGALLDARGRLIGVCSGKADGRGYYGHADEVHKFLRQNGLRWLYADAR